MMPSTTSFPRFTPSGDICVRYTPPLWLVCVWLGLVGLINIVSSGLLDVFLCTLCLAYMCVICYMFTNIINKNQKIKKMNKNNFMFVVKLGDLLTPQGGEEMTKEDRRFQYERKKQSKEKEIARKSPPSMPKCRARKKCNGKKKILYPQLGVDNLRDAISSLANVNGVALDDLLLSKIENLCALFVAVKDCESLPQLLAILFLYFKTHYSKSVANMAASYLAVMLEGDFDPQLGEFSVDDKRPKWLRILKECQTNWALVVNHEGFKKVSHIISICLALGLCEAASFNFELSGMKLFSLGAAPKHATAMDLVDAVVETVGFFVEGGYACFERRSLRPLLYGNIDNENFETMYSKCLRCNEYARAGNLEKYEKNNAGGPMTENDYDATLSQCIEKCGALVSTCKGVVEKNLLNRKLDMLRHWQSTFRQTRIQGGLREAPYSIGIYGGTAVGKSTIANVLMVSTLMMNGFSATDDRIVTINESDKFMSNYRSYINGVLVDDIGNTKAQFVEKAPTTLMIQLVNNVRMYANMAEVELKGKVSVEPKVVISTKNVKDTCATVFSNEPASITRRDRVLVTAVVKPQYASDGMLDADKVKAFCPHLYEDACWRCPDLWELKIEHSFPVPSRHVGGAATVGWKVVTHEGRSMEKIGLPEFIRWVALDSKRFYQHQANLVSTNNNVAEKMVLCEACNLPTPDVCLCPKKDSNSAAIICDECTTDGLCSACGVTHVPISSHADVPQGLYPSRRAILAARNEECLERISQLREKLKPQLGEKIAIFFLQRYFKWNKFIDFFQYWSERAEQVSVSWMITRLEWLENSPWCRWTNWIPTMWMQSEYTEKLVLWTEQENLRARIKRAYLNHFLIQIVIFAVTFIWCYALLLSLCNLLAVSRVINVEKKLFYDEIVANNASMPQIFKLYRDRHIKWITGLCVSIAILYSLVCIWRAIKVTPLPQGNISPLSEQDITVRDAEINPWAGVRVTPMPCSHLAKTTTVEQLQTLVERNLCYMELQATVNGLEKKYFCNAFFPKSNVAIVPNHMWMADTMKAKFVRHDPAMIGGNFSSYLCKGSSVHIPDTDLSLVWVPNGGDWKDLTPYLPLDIFRSVPGRLVYKQKDGSILTSVLYMTCQKVTTIISSYMGSMYQLQFPTFEGLCMAPILTESKGPMIGGFHLGGRSGEKTGCSGVLLKKQLDAAYEKLRLCDSVILSKSESEIPKKLYDVQFFQSDAVHPKSPINFLPEGTNVKYYGQIEGRAKYYSEVIPTIISKHVHDVCGVPPLWGPPKFNKGYPFQESLQFSARPSIGVDGNLVARASRDYLTGFLNVLDRFPNLKRDVRPLSELETVCGIDGKRFIDKMPPNTSVGYPLSGPKKNHLIYLDPQDHPTHQCPALLDKMFWDEAYRMEELYRNGERAYPMFKACLKDEPTKLTKDKVRVFQGAPIAMQLLVRKYFLPIARALSMLPLVSECAVGINAQGPEWDTLTRHVCKFGKDRILAGDYNKYDLRMPAQLLFAAFKILIDIGVHCGYTAEHVCIMEGIATDICYPLMAYNGDLIQHIGSHPSGQNLTAYANSIVNSLLFRCAYFYVTRERQNVPAFRDICALTTYGDDAKSSVREDFSEFNHLTMTDFLAMHDMKFTMPDKESEPTEYMSDDKADFLKRASVFCEETGMYMGALDENSIFKSLHVVLASGALTKEEQAAVNIDGGLREWFCHGREVYEKRRSQMIEVAQRANIAHISTMIHRTYDELLVDWKAKYLPGE